MTLHPSLKIEPAFVVTGEIEVTRHEHPPAWVEIWRKGQKKQIELMTESEKAEWEEWAKADCPPPGGEVTKSLFRQFGHGFGEAVYAQHLRETGSECWTGARLFRREGTVKGRKFELAVTEHIEALLREEGFHLPAEVESHVLCEPKSPDLVAHSEKGEWAFFEIKRGDRLLPGQLEGLLLLHLLTGGEARVVRIVPEGSSSHSRRRMHKVQFVYKGPLADVVAGCLKSWVEEADSGTARQGRCDVHG